MPARDSSPLTMSRSIEKGEIFGFLGPSGAGKSTVQGLMTGLLGLQRGEIRYGETPVQHLKSDFFNRIGVSFELPNSTPSSVATKISSILPACSTSPPVTRWNYWS